MLADELNPNEIISRFQEESNQSFIGKMEMRRVRPGKDDRISIFKIWRKNKDYSLARFLEPAREKGLAWLKVKDEMYMYLPSATKTMRVSGGQRMLNSDFANADLLGIDLIANYDSSLDGSQSLDNIDHYVISLKAKKQGVPYDKIKLWIRKKDFLQGREEFYTLSGRLLQFLIFENYEVMGGQLQPVKLIMKNTLVEGQYTVVTILEKNYCNIPDSTFTVFNLPHGFN
jgi:hypothetical protein